MSFTNRVQIYIGEYNFKNFTTYVTEVRFKEKPTTTLVFTSSDFSVPVGPVHPTGQTGRHYPADSTGQTGPTDRSDRSAQNRGAAHSALKCATRQLPNLRVSLHHLPPLCIPADELDTAGTEVDVRMA